MKLLFTCCFSFFQILLLISQTPTKEFGLTAGGSVAYCDLVETGFSSFKETKFSFGAYIRDYLSNSLALRAGVNIGQFSGNDSNFERNKLRGFSFSSSFQEIALDLSWEPFGNKRFNPEASGTISPYLFGGLAYLNHKTTTKYSFENESLLDEIAIDQNEDVSKGRLVIPMGLGIKFDLSQKVSFGIEYGNRITFTDYLDGVSASGNPNKNDWYGIGNVQFIYRFNDKDKDGIANKFDPCPDYFGLKENNGCPDTDLDGFVDIEDACPEIPGTASLRGCPDFDGDGVADHLDTCPEEAGRKKSFWLPRF